jgi:hypothetical protein
MNRRNLLSLATLSTLAWAITPLSAKTNTDPWKATHSQEVIESLYPNTKIILDKNIKIRSSYTDCMSNLSLYIQSNIEAKRVLILQDLDPIPYGYSFSIYSLVCIFEVPLDALVKYSVRIDSMNRDLKIIALIEDIEGNVFMNTLIIT